MVGEADMHMMSGALMENSTRDAVGDHIMTSEGQPTPGEDLTNDLQRILRNPSVAGSSVYSEHSDETEVPQLATPSQAFAWNWSEDPWPVAESSHRSGNSNRMSELFPSRERARSPISQGTMADSLTEDFSNSYNKLQVLKLPTLSNAGLRNISYKQSKIVHTAQKQYMSARVDRFHQRRSPIRSVVIEGLDATVS